MIFISSKIGCTCNCFQRLIDFLADFKSHEFSLNTFIDKNGAVYRM